MGTSGLEMLWHNGLDDIACLKLVLELLRFGFTLGQCPLSFYNKFWGDCNWVDCER